MEDTGNRQKLQWNILEGYGNCLEHNGSGWKPVEPTSIIQIQARLTPTLTHVITCNPVTSDAESG